MTFLQDGPLSSQCQLSSPEEKAAASGTEAWIDLSRIAAAFAVVCLHVSAGIVAQAPFGSFSWWCGNVADSAMRWSVPVFVMISGILLLRPEKSESLGGFYGRRLRRILIPTVFWTIVFTLLAYAESRARGVSLSPAYLVINILLGVPHYHMWFLYMLAGLYVFTPFFRKIVQQSSPKELLFLVVLLFAMSLVSYGFEFIYPGVPMVFTTRSMLYLPYFFAGCLLAAWKNPPATGVLIALLALSVGLATLGTYLLHLKFGGARGFYFYGELSAAVVPMSLCVLLLLKKFFGSARPSRRMREIAALTFGVYLIHPLFIEGLGALGWKAASYPPLLAIPVFSAVIFGFSLATAQILSFLPFLRRTI